MFTLERVNNILDKVLKRVGISSWFGIAEWESSLGVTLPTEPAEKKEFVINLIRDYRNMRAYTMSEYFDFDSDEWTKVLAKALFLFDADFKPKGTTVDEVIELNNLVTDEDVTNYMFDYMRYAYWHYAIRVTSRVSSIEIMKEMEANCIDIDAYLVD